MLGTGTMLILRGVSDASHPRGLLDDASALEYAKRRGYVGEVLDVRGNTGPRSDQVTKALARIRQGDVTALYGFSGGGYNARHILNAMNDEAKKRLKLVVILGAPNQPSSAFDGDWELVYRKDPRQGHMAGPRVLLESLPEVPRPMKRLPIAGAVIATLTAAAAWAYQSAPALIAAALLIVGIGMIVWAFKKD